MTWLLEGYTDELFQPTSMGGLFQIEPADLPGMTGQIRFFADGYLYPRTYDVEVVEAQIRGEAVYRIYLTLDVKAAPVRQPATFLEVSIVQTDAAPGTMDRAGAWAFERPLSGPAPWRQVPGLDGPTCAFCGGMTQRTGTCATCLTCGQDTGCG